MEVLRGPVDHNGGVRQTVACLQRLVNTVQVLQMFSSVSCNHGNVRSNPVIEALQPTFISEFVPTDVTLERSLAGVSPVMIFQLAAGLEILLADIADEPVTRRQQSDRAQHSQ